MDRDEFLDNLNTDRLAFLAWGKPPDILHEFPGICRKCKNKVLSCEWAAYRRFCENCWVLLHLFALDVSDGRPAAVRRKVLAPDRNGFAGAAY